MQANRAPTLDQITAPDDVEDNERLERIRHVVGRLSSLLTDSDAELLTPKLLDDINYHLPDLLSELRGYREDGESRWLESASVSIVDPLIDRVGWPLAYVAADPAGLRDAAANYRRAAGQFLRGVEEDVEALRARLTELNEAIEAAKATANQAATTATEAIEASAAAAEQRVADVASNIDAEKTRFDALTTEYQRTFTASEAARTQKFDAALAEEVAKHEEIRTRLDEAFQVAVDGLTERAGSTMASLEEQRAEALKLVNATGAIAYSGSYGGYAAQQGKMANIWAIVTVVALILVAAFGVWQVLQLSGPVDPVQLILRLVVTLPVFALVAFAARESGRHRENERRARRLELELAAIDPYLALLDEEQRKEIKAAVASRMFAQPDLAKGEDGLSAFDKELVGIAKEAVKK